MNLCNNLHKLCPENLVKKYNNCCLYSKDGERRYYYFNNLTKVENGKKVTIIMINPSKEKEHPKDNLLDNTISNVRGILEKYNKNANDKISSFEVVNLFSNKNSDPKNIINDDGVEELLRNFSKQGKTPLIFASNKKILGLVAIKDEIKPHSKRAIQELNKMGIKTIMLTGDNLETAKVIAEEVGIKEYIANVLPLDKQNVINSLKSDSHHLVAMVGDGVNDSLALANADLSISLGHGSDIAIETSDIVLLRDDLLDVKNVIKLSKRTINTIKFGLFWAFFYNCIGVILASGAFYPSFGIRLNPMIGSLCMSFSSVFVVLNALTINFFKVDKDDKTQNIDKPIKRKEVKKMEKITLHVEGMMCMHCVKHVEDALKKVDGVKIVDVSLDKKEAIIEGENLNKEELIKAIVASGYQAS